MQITLSLTPRDLEALQAKRRHDLCRPERLRSDADLLTAGVIDRILRTVPLPLIPKGDKNRFLGPSCRAQSPGKSVIRAICEIRG